jgi:hypothetical protein
MRVPSTDPQALQPNTIVVERKTRQHYRILFLNEDGTMAVQPMKGVTVNKWRVKCEDFDLLKTSEKVSSWPLPAPATIPKGSTLRPAKLRSGLGD